MLRHRAGKLTLEADAIAAALASYASQPLTTAQVIGVTRRQDVQIPTTMNEELASFLGYLVGDGHISRVKRNFGLTTGDLTQAIAFEQHGEALFGLKARRKKDGGRYRSLFHSETVSEFLTHGLGLTHGPSASEKQIPASILRSPEPVDSRVSSRVRYDCDGYAGKSGVILVTKSDLLAEQTQLLLLNFGILSRKRHAKDGCWRLQIQGKSTQTFSEKIGFGLVRKQRALQEYIDGHQWFLEEKWEDEVMSLEPSRADVYDISVEGTHRYAAAGFIHHNSYWHSKLMTTKILDASEIVDYADNNAGVMATSGGRLNPYKLGVELYRNIEERWDKGQFGKEWEECDDLDAKRHWNLRLGLGKKKIFEVRSLYNDVTFIDEFLTADFCREQKLFSFAYSNRNERFEIESREFKQVKEKLLFQLTNAGNPFLYVEDANYDNRGELLIRHEHQGLDLKADYARECMKSLVRVWKRPVNLLAHRRRKTGHGALRRKPRKGLDWLHAPVTGQWATRRRSWPQFERDPKHWLLKGCLAAPDEWIRAAMRELRRAEEGLRREERPRRPRRRGPRRGDGVERRADCRAERRVGPLVHGPSSRAEGRRVSPRARPRRREDSWSTRRSQAASLSRSGPPMPTSASSRPRATSSRTRTRS